MGKNANYVSHKKSKLKNQDGSPQLPSASALVEGEIAINFAENVETLSIKNESGDVVTFSSDNYYSEQKLGSAFTGANSAVTVTDLIDEVNVSNGVEPTNESVEIWVDTSASPITVDVYSKTEVNSLLTTHTGNTAIHLSGSEKENIDSLSGNVSVLSAITAADIEKWNNGGDLSNYYTKSETSGSSEISTALDDKQDTSGMTAYTTTATTNTLSGNVTAHTADTTIHFTTGDVQTQIADSISGKADTSALTEHTSDTDIHVTTSDKTAWNAKLDSSDIANFFDDAKYELSGTTQVINFYNGNTIKATIDATDFIKDGMIDTVSAGTSGNTTVLVITWNTDAGKSQTVLDIGDMFEADNYYTKTDVDTKLGSAFTGANSAVTITDYLAENELVISSSLNDLNTRKLDASAYTPTDLSNYYTKSETSGASEISTALAAKTDTATTTALNNVVTGHTANTSIHLSSTEKTNLDSLETNIVAISGITSTKVGNWDGAATNSHTHSNKSVLDGISSSDITNWNGKTSNVGTVTNVQLSLPTGLSASTTAITSSGTFDIALSNGYSIPTTTKQGQWDTAYTNNHTHDNKSALDSITGSVGSMAYENTSSYSSATQVSTALSGKSNTGHTHTKSEITDFPSSMPASDVYSWAKAENKPSYSASEITGLGNSATLNTGTTAGTVAAGDHNHSGVYQPVGSYLTGISSSDVTTALGYTPYNSSNPNNYTSNVGTVTSVQISLPTGLSASTTAVTSSGKFDIALSNGYSIPTTTKQGQWDTAYTNSHTHGNKSTLDAITASSTAINSLTGSVGTMAFQNTGSYSSATQVNTALEGKSNTGHGHSISEITNLQTTLDGKVNTGVTISAGAGLSGGGDLSTNRTISLAMPTTYSAETYTTSNTFTSSAPIVYALCVNNTNLTNQVCPVSGLADGQQCDVIYMGSTTAATYTVSISTDYKTPSGNNLDAFTVPANGYVEINYINIKGTIFVRGI